MSSSSRLALKIPPVGVFLFSALGIWLIQFFGTDLSLGEFRLVARVFYMLGALAGFAGLLSFHKLKTSIDPTHPEKASKLVTIGIYRVMRNPMYLGLLLVLTGWVLRWGNPIASVMLVFFVWFMNRFQVGPEERVLSEKFGREYLDYASKTRRWI